MKYGLTRQVDIYCYEKETGHEVYATAGDYMRSQKWASENLGGMEEGMANLYQTYAWVWFALSRLGKLDEFGIKAEINEETIEEMAGLISVHLEPVPDDSLPLANSGTRRKR